MSLVNDIRPTSYDAATANATGYTGTISEAAAQIWNEPEIAPRNAGRRELLDFLRVNGDRLEHSTLFQDAHRLGTELERDTLIPDTAVTRVGSQSGSPFAPQRYKHYVLFNRRESAWYSGVQTTYGEPRRIRGKLAAEKLAESLRTLGLGPFELVEVQ